MTKTLIAAGIDDAVFKNLRNYKKLLKCKKWAEFLTKVVAILDKQEVAKIVGNVE